MKSVMISINPKYCEFILNGIKTVEVRKTKPKLEAPFKCYIYCTKGDALAYPCLNNNKFFILRANNGTVSRRRMTENDIKHNDHSFANGKVIAEFICNKINILFNTYGNPENYMKDTLPEILKKSNLSYEEFSSYVGSRALNNHIYGWHISDLNIYEKPKELKEFKKYNRQCYYADLGLAIPECSECRNKECFVQRPSQNWCYVEELLEKE